MIDSKSKSTAGWLLPLLLFLFVGSGCSALIYEIVWLQLLQLVIGSSAVSLAVLLGTFMGGMCLGSLFLSRFVSSKRHPFRVYAAIEFGIALCGLAVLFIIPIAGRLYSANAVSGFVGILMRGVVCAVCLLAPTVLMGATLPAIARWIEATPRGVSWLGLFYGGNIAGAVFGCLFAGFYLLRVYDMATATMVAAAINGVVAFTGMILARRASYVPMVAPCSSSSTDVPRETSSELRWTIYVAIALSGMTALGAEVVWTRLLSLLLGATVYTFSIILAVILIGLGIGSSIGAALARGTARPWLALATCQLLLILGITWGAGMIARSLPYWPVEPNLTTNPWLHFQLDLVRCMWAVLPAACLWGASFPLALAATVGPGQDCGRLVGRAYAANTAGAILGALVFTLVVIPRKGTQFSQVLLILIAAFAAQLVLLPRLWRRSKTAPRRLLTTVGSAVAVIAISILLIGTVSRIPWQLVAYGRNMPTRIGESQILYMGEGMNSSIAVSEMLNDGVRNFHVSGKVEASSEPQDMRLQRMLGHIPALVHPQPKSVLIVGCGAGVTAGSFVVHPSIERILICEIEPLIPPMVASRHFSNENHGVVTDSRVKIVYDDARHFVLTTRDKFDIITSDPIHPWVKGAATLYTREYFELCKQHLNPGGVITQWVPLYESNNDVVKSEIATFMEAFPQGTIWGNDVSGKGYDIVLLGQNSPTQINVDEMQSRLDRTDHARVKKSLADVHLGSAIDLLSTYAGHGPQLAEWMKGAEINRDRNLRLQYLAGMGVDFSQGERIYDGILKYRQYSDTLFIASRSTANALRDAIEKSGK